MAARTMSGEADRSNPQRIVERKIMSKKKSLNKKSRIAIKRKAFNKTKARRVSESISSALLLYEQGDIRGAKRAFQNILKTHSGNKDALYYLGNIAKSQGKHDEAIDYYNKAISIDPQFINSYFNLGGVFIDNGKYDNAYEQFQKIVLLSPDYANAWFNLGFIEAARGKHDEAIKFYEKALSIKPDFTNAWYNIGWILLDQKKYDEAARYFEKAISLDAGHADALFNLGFISMENKDNKKAIEYYEAVIKKNPEYYLAYNNLGLIYQMEHQLDRAFDYYEKALSINPEFSDAYLNMGNVFRARGDSNKAVEYYKKSVDLKPSLVGLLNLFGHQKEMCLYEEASELTAKALEYKNLKKSDLASIHDTFIQTCEWEKASDIIDRFRDADMDAAGKDILAGSFMEFCAITDLSLDEISEQHKICGNLTEQERTPFEHGRVFSDRKRKKIRIGYSSPDLRTHSVGYLIKDIIKSHNHDEFEIYCYANFNPKDMDSFTQEMINSSDLFKYVKHLSDKELAEEIYGDEIDILIDLAGHTAGHRLRSFAYKPAPIQITYLGYPNTTGLSRIDYRLTDRFAESGEEYDYRYSEKLIRLTNCFLSFNGFGDVVPAEIKENRGEKIIFGCFNNIQKLTAKAVELWSKILKAIPNSELHLKAKQLNTPFIWDNIAREFAKYDVSEEKIKCLGYTATREEHLRLYNSIDISLDTFPYNGTVTTLEALWMNMPVITLVGESHAQRVGYSILKNLDLDQLIAFSEEGYVSKAIELAGHPEMIKELKTRMRKNLLASSICNPKVITREMELNYKRIWMEYTEEGIGKREEAENHREEKRRKKEEGIGKREEDRGKRQEGRGSRPEDSLGEAISAASRLRMAMVKLEAGEYEKAVEISSSLIGSNGVSSLAWYVLGVSYHRLEKEQDALHALEECLSLDENNTGARMMLEEIRGRSTAFEERPCGLEEQPFGV